MLNDVDYRAFGEMIEEILDIVEPIPENATEKEREEKEEWRQMYVMSSLFAKWNPESLKKFLERIRGQKEKNEKIDYMDFSNL